MKRLSGYLFSVLVATVLLLGVSSCAEEMEVLQEKVHAILQLNITLDGCNTATRANGDIFFEDPASQYERINSLRVIVVSKGLVEINEFTGNLNGIDFLRKDYLVEPDTKKIVYLIANEESVNPVLNGKEISFEDYKVGMALPWNFAEIIIEGNTNGQIVDNEKSMVMKYVPMSEIFNVEIGSSEIGDSSGRTFVANLFLTRATTKFSFFINEQTELKDNLSIDKITIASLADKEYLFPKETVYFPDKYSGGSGERYISSFSVPQDIIYSLRVLSPSGFGRIFNKATGRFDITDYSPSLYFAESGLKAHYIKLECTLSNGVMSERKLTFTSDALKNLPALPRNTHVRIGIRFRVHQDDVVVDIQPYTGVELNPELGFDEPLPRPPYEGEAPPWVDIDPDNEN